MYTHKCKLPPPSTDVTGSKFMRYYKRSIQIWEKSPYVTSQHMSEVNIEEERKRHVSTNPWIIHPYSQLRTYYDFWMIYVLMFTLNWFPVYIAFPTWNSRLSFHIDLLAYMMCVVFNLFDMWMTFRTAYVDGDGKVVYEPKMIAKHYLRSSWLILDTIMFVFGPVYVCYAMFYIRDIRFIVKEFSVFALFKLGRLLLYVRSLYKFVGVSDRCAKLWRCFLLTWGIFHVVACLIVLVSRYRWIYGKDFPFLTKGSWIRNLGITFETPIVEMYIRSLYRSTTALLSIKRSRYYTEERVWEESVISSLVNIFGRFFMGWITVILLEVFLAQTGKERQYQETLTQITSYMCRKNVPDLMQGRVIRYYEYRFNRTIFKESAIQESLSAALLTQFQLHDMSTLMKNVSFFEKLNKKTLHCISRNLSLDFFLENDTIIRAGDPGDCMYFIRSGTVAVLTPSGEEICHLQDGSYFGEVSLVLKNTTRTATVVSIERCTLYRLDRKALRTCIRDSKVIEELEAMARQRQDRVEEMMASARELI